MSSIKKIINIEANKTAFVCGLGPSLGDSIKFINENRTNIVFISCNDIDLVCDIIPDYWVFANSISTIVSMYERIIKYKDSVIVHSDSVDTTPIEWIEKNLINVKYIGYDQRHFDNKKCSNCPNNCNNFVENRLTLQEELQNYTGNPSRYGSGDTVALHMLALSILLGCKKIYLTGVDLNYKKGYFNSKTINSDSFDPYLENILNDFKIILESAEKVGVQIINLSQDSPLSTIFNTEKL
jgi:hypothetical protein